MMHLSTPPKDLDDNLDYRTILLAECDTPARQKDVLERCQADPLWWINSFAYQYNPKSVGRYTPKVGPFITWDFQDRAVAKIRRCIQDGEDLVIEKSRDMGISWLCLLIIGHSYLFERWQKYLIISRNEKAVDNPGDSDSLFWRVDYVFERLPDWMMRCNRDDARRKMGFEHPFTRSAITGQATTGKAGVGGRCTAMFIDEFSQIDEAYEVLQRTSDTTSCRIFNGTHAPAGLAFAEITDDETAAGSFIEKLQLHWTEHPDKRRGLYRYNPLKNEIDILDKTYEFPPDYEFVYSELPTGGPHPGLRSPHYDVQVSRKGSTRAVAMDLDIDRGGGSSKFFDALVIKSLVAKHCCEPYWRGDLKYDPDSAEPIKLIEDHDGPLKLWLHPSSEDTVPASDYGAGNDISQGTGTTPSVCSIGDSRTGQKVAELATAQLPADKFAVCVVALCKLFKNEDGQPALLSWETSGGPGSLFGKTLGVVGYRRLMPRASRSIVRGAVNDVYGWVSNQQSKKALLTDYYAGLRNHSFINRSEEAMEECNNYRHSDRRDAVEHPKDVGGDDPSVARSNHGDRVIADAICWMALQYLGAGKPAKVREQEQPPPVNSLLWRREKRARQRQAEGAWI